MTAANKEGDMLMQFSQHYKPTCRLDLGMFEFVARSDLKTCFL
jgi:hypothetical protein